YYMLRRALDGGAPPSALVVDFEHTRLAEDPCPASALPAWSQLLSPAEAFDLALQTGDVSFAGRLLVAGLLPTVRIRHDVRAAVAACLEGRSASRRTAA